jgi:hypothetical protein
MIRTIFELPGRAKRQIVRDFRIDPYLPYILVLATVLSGFWFWHGVPNFATRDERDRMFDVLVVYGTFLEDPGFESLKASIKWGRVPFAGTFYLYVVVLFPVVLAALLVGESEAILAFSYPDPTFGFWPVWHETPKWIWTWSLVLVRLTSVAFAVGSVYLTYRIGTTMRDRQTGRLSAVLLTLTFGFLVLAHEGGEDMPALFFVLLSIYLALRYTETGDAAPFLVGCASGGVAIAFKLTAAPVVLLLGVAYFLRARNAGLGALVRPLLLTAGAVIGAAAIVLGFPSVLVSGPELLVERVEGAVSRTERFYGPNAPIWWWYLRNYLNGLGLPLFVGSIGGILASLPRLRERSTESNATLLLLTGVAAYLLLYSSWHDFRVHHLLPTFPLLAVLIAAPLSRLSDHSPGIARPVIAVLLVTSGTYAVVGDLGYATQPRDEAVEWLQQNVPENATMEVYRRDMQDAAIPHGMTIYHPNARGQRAADNVAPRCPDYIQLTYRDLYYLNPDTYLRNDPERAAYFRALLRDGYNYEIVATFGDRPQNYVARPSSPGSVRDALRVGITPRVVQYGDEQDLGSDQYTAILRRTGPCDGSRDPPFECPGFTGCPTSLAVAEQQLRYPIVFVHIK